MAKYILCNRDPFNLVRQKCDANLPGAGDPPISPGNGKEFVKQNISKSPYCFSSGSDSDNPCGQFAGGLNPGYQTEQWKAGWKKHNAAWGSLPRNKKRPNILDQNANFVCLQILQDTWRGCTNPNPPEPPGCPFGTCNKPSHKFSMTDRSAMQGSNECGFCKKCACYYIGLGLSNKYNRNQVLINNLI